MSAICWTAHNWIRQQNVFGITLFQYNNEANSCYDGVYITNVPTYRQWPSNECCGWSYQTLVSDYTSGGQYQTSFTYFSQAKFSLTWCPCQNRYPWLNTRVNGDGSGYLTGGID
jgi:hypothetical protein